MKIKEQLKYSYKNAPIPGGGYVTGFAFHNKVKDILYARTDIGGVYRYEYKDKVWKSLVEHVKMTDIAEAFPIAIALDDKHPEYLYIACGMYEADCGKLCISEDYGETFRYETIPVPVHGNLSGRGTGYRLVVDKNNSDVIYFASQLSGLLVSKNRGKSWERMPVPEDYTTCIWMSEDSKTIVCGTAGYSTKVNERLRGHGMYVSYNGGESFTELMEPEAPDYAESRMNGLVAGRLDFDGKYLYATMNNSGRWNYRVDLGYSCDTGDLLAGHVVRYSFENGKITGFKDITPGREGGYADELLPYGFGGVCSCASMPGLLVCSTICKEMTDYECIYISKDYGDSWELSLEGLKKGGLYFNTSYMRPEHNGDRCLLHWASDIKINPFNPDEVWFNSGTGIFSSDALTTDNPAYHDQTHGVEETVHLNVYAPLDGEVKLLDIVGDLGCFAFRDLDKPCKNSMDDAEGNRYITCINADMSDYNSDVAIITARGNWKGKTKGGLVRTRDNYKTYERIPMPFGINEDIDELLHRIERPNVNAGWVAMSPDCKNIVWSIADNVSLPVKLVVSTQDEGASFDRAIFFDITGEEVAEGYVKVFADRCNSNVFYGFDDVANIYISTDCGKNFYRKQVAAIADVDGNELDVFTDANFGLIDTANKTEIRVSGGEEGIVYIATGKDGLWKMQYDVQTDKIRLIRLTDEGDEVMRVGLGVGREGGDYLKEPKAIYLSGIIDGEYGMYRSLDECKSYSRINNGKQMFGDINSIDGDKREFGRFFIASGTRGVLYGEPDKG